jgi:hypothetical protein
MTPWLRLLKIISTRRRVNKLIEYRRTALKVTDFGLRELNPLLSSRMNRADCLYDLVYIDQTQP